MRMSLRLVCIALLAVAAIPGSASAMRGYLGGPIWSPDGTQIAFAGDSPRYGAYVMRADGGSLHRILTNTSTLDLAWSPDGRRFVFAAYPKNEGAQIWTVGVDGRGPVNLTKKASKHRQGNDYAPVWSPDGRRVAFERFSDIATMSSAGGGFVRLTHDRVSDGAPVWSPDGRQIAFLSMRGGCCPNPGDGASFDLYVMNADGTGLRRLTHDAQISNRPVWAPDSSALAYSAPASGGGSDIFVVNAATASVLDLTRTPTNESEPAWSPDGTQIAYNGEAYEYGSYNGIYVMNADGGGQRRLTEIGENADSLPSWSPSGGRIAFLRTYGRSQGPLGFIYAMNPDGSDQRRLIP
jgi:TolB protein